MEFLEDLKYKLCDELETRAKKKDFSSADLGVLHTLTDTIKNIYKIEMFEEVGEGEYSRADGEGYSARRYSRDGGESYRGHSYDGEGGGSSYARRGEHHVRGHYSRDEGGRYSRAEGQGSMMDRMHEMLESAENDKQREAIRRCISQLENM